MANDTSPQAPLYVPEALQDAERLLKYAAETGVQIDPALRDSVLRARAAGSDGWDEKTVGNLLEALTQLAARLKPITARSLQASQDDIEPTFRSYERVFIALAICIGLFSTLGFLTTGVSKIVTTDIATANDLAAKLRAQLGAPSTAAPTNDASQPPPGLSAVEVVTELQQYAATIRAIDARARQLNAFTFWYEKDPFRYTRTNRNTFQLEVGLPNLQDAAEKRTRVYQDVRSFAQSVVDNVSIFYGALTACILPVLYALFGTCAYLLRNLEQQMETRSFIPTPARYARFLIAAIGGQVVGLFNFTLTQGASISPLAIAFLVGYAVDVFFMFLEGLLQSFTKRAT